MMSISGVIYVGVTSNLQRRVYEHKHSIYKGFTNTYNCKKLVYYEEICDVGFAISREKQIKKWNRKKKESLIKTINPDFIDLYL